MATHETTTPKFGKATTEDLKEHLKDAASIQTEKLAEETAKSDISNLPLRTLIGGPLLAAVHAIQECTIGTIAFVKDQCFMNGSGGDGLFAKDASGKYTQTGEKYLKDGQLSATSGLDWGRPRYLSFEYTKTSSLGLTTPSIFRVPLMVMVPIPTLRLEFISVEFLCRINTIETYNAGINSVAVLKREKFTTNNQGGEDDNEESDLQPIQTSLGPVNAMRVNQAKTSSGSTVTKEYSYNVKVRAVDDEKPPGIEKLFEILDTLISETSGDDATFDSLLNPGKLPDITDFGFNTGGA